MIATEVEEAAPRVTPDIVGAVLSPGDPAVTKVLLAETFSLPDASVLLTLKL